MKREKAPKRGFRLILLLMATGIAWGDANYSYFSHPGIPVGGREGRNIMDQGDFLMLEMREGETPMKYTLGPLKTSPGALVEFTATIALEKMGANPECYISLLARDKKGRELAADLAAMEPDYSITAPEWQTVVNRAIMPEDTQYVELRLELRTPMILHSKEEGIKGLGMWQPPQEDSLKKKARISNGLIDVVFNPVKKRMGVNDNRVGKTWEMLPLPDDLELERIQSGKMNDGNRVILIEGVFETYGTPFRMVLLLPPDRPELLCRTELSNALSMPEGVAGVDSVPRIKAAGEGHQLVVPVGQKLIYPVNDKDMEPMKWRLLTNPAWFGVSEGDAGPAVMCLVESFQHAELSMSHVKLEDGTETGTVTVVWLPLNDKWEYPREARFWFADAGGPPAMHAYFVNRGQ